MADNRETIVLGIETTTVGCSVALLSNGVSTTRFEEAGRNHSDRLLPMVESLLSQEALGVTDLDGVAFGAGPGSFVGSRIGAAVAHALALAAGVDAVPVSSLAALALAESAPLVAVAVDARMDQVYWGCYRQVADDRVELIGQERVVDPGEVSLPEEPTSECWFGTGSGWGLYGRLMNEVLGGRVVIAGEKRLPHAREVARLGLQALQSGRITEETALPSYVRQRVATPPGEKG